MTFGEGKLPPSVFELRLRAVQLRQFAREHPDAATRFLDYADELDLRANNLEEADDLRGDTGS